MKSRLTLANLAPWRFILLPPELPDVFAPAWLPRVQRRLRPFQGRTLVLAVSGGADSVGLLLALNALAEACALHLSVAHLDHGARGPESAADARFVAELAARLRLPFDLGRWQPERPGHFEADARRARYAWLARVARDRGAAAVAVGHTRDDQAETILHRLLRGTGPHGLSGMPARRPLADGVALVRPLLDVGRDAIRDSLSALGQPWHEDATNADIRRTRARLRHDLLPRLAADYNPRVAEALVRLGRLARDQQRLLRRWLVPTIRPSVAPDPGDPLRLDAAWLRSQPRPLRAEALRAAWRLAGWPERAMTTARWLRLSRLLDRPQGRLSLGSGVEAIVDADALVLVRCPAPQPPAPEPVAWPLPGSAYWFGLRLTASLEPDPTPAESIDLDALDPFGSSDSPRLLIRSPASGDRFAPLGLSGRTRPLNDFFRGRRVPRLERPRVPLACDRRGIVWVVGHRIADRVRTTPCTRRLLHLRPEPDEPPP